MGRTHRRFSKDEIQYYGKRSTGHSSWSDENEKEYHHYMSLAGSKTYWDPDDEEDDWDDEDEYPRC